MKATPPKIFAELFAGSGAVTLQLVGGAKLGPPVSYMGSKRYYAIAILAAFGLLPGLGAGSLLLCDGGPWGWVWQALADPTLARAVAAVLRSWRHEDPTELWRRLAAEPPPEVLVELAATVLWLQGRTASNVPLWWEPAQGEAAGRWVMQSDDAKPYRAQQVHGGRYSGLRSTETVADRVSVIADAMARWIALQEGNHAGKAVHVTDGRWKVHGYGHLSNSARERGFKERLRVDLVADQVEQVAALPWAPLGIVHGDVDAALALLPHDLSEAVVYLDPPYQGATRYAVSCERERVLDLARELDGRGAFVGISEAEPLPLPGWHSIEITHARKGIPRSTSKQKREFLTLNRPPVGQVAQQVGLFGGGP